MRIIYSVILLSLLAVGASAQNSVTPIDTPNVTVIKYKWRFQVRNPALDENPLLAIEERVQVEQDIRDTNAENRRRARIGAKPVNPPERPPTRRKDGRASALYIYEVKVKNTGKKVIRILTLDYIFFEPETKQEIGRRKFVSKKDIASGKTMNLVFRSAAPPTGTIDAKRAGKKSLEGFSEQVIIQSAEFADGSSWQAVQKNQ